LQTVWATTSDLRTGHRRTDIEALANPAHLLRRVTELAPAIFGLDKLAVAA
jgi:hypothetical protein